jgi:hypothetical protein
MTPFIFNTTSSIVFEAGAAARLGDIAERQDCRRHGHRDAAATWLSSSQTRRWTKPVPDRGIGMLARDLLGTVSQQPGYGRFMTGGTGKSTMSGRRCAVSYPSASLSAPASRARKRYLTGDDFRRRT